MGLSARNCGLCEGDLGSWKTDGDMRQNTPLLAAATQIEMCIAEVPRSKFKQLPNADSNQGTTDLKPVAFFTEFELLLFK